MEAEGFDDSYDVSLFEEGLLKYVCQRCSFIRDISSKSEKCPSCGLSNDFGIYPVLSAVDILYSLYEIVNIATLKQKNILKKIQNNLKLELGKEFEFNKIENVLIDFCKVQNSSGEVDFDKLKERIKNKLFLEDEDDSDKAFNVFLTGDNRNRLYKSIVILSATLLEIIFKDYMEKVLTKRTSKVIAPKIMESLKHKSIEEHFNQITPFLLNDLKHELKEVESGFYDKWDTLRKQRNKLIHKNGLDISSKRAIEIFDIAKKSVSVFMVLNNKLTESP